jgi:hypothetical protein
MAQTPARDFIKSAVVDFRFHGGDVRNYANTAWTLAGSGFAPTIQPIHGVRALTYCDAPADQSWMTAAQTAVTIEALLSLDMFHLGETGTEAKSASVIDGDWNLGLYQSPAAGETSNVAIWASFNGGDIGGGGYYIDQKLTSAAVATSLHKGSPLHIIMSAKYTVGGPLLEVVTMVNGVYDTASTAVVDHSMTEAPTNTLFNHTLVAPVYSLRMWNSYLADEQVYADLYREARKVLPTVSFPLVVANGLTLTSPS